VISFACACPAIAAPADSGKSGAKPAEPEIAKAFSDAAAELLSRQREDAAGWFRFAAQARAVAGKLVKGQGKAIGEYIRDVYLPAQRSESAGSTAVPDFLAILTLDALEMHDAAARAALAMITRGGHQSVILMVSFCSEKTRQTAANFLYSERIAHPEYEYLSPTRNGVRSTNWEWHPLPSYLAVVGNKQTLELLQKEGNEERKKRLIADPNMAKDIARWISNRLSLPAEKQAQRAKDELLYWQADEDGPRPVNTLLWRAGCAADLHKAGASISSAYLIELLNDQHSLPAVVRADVPLVLAIIAEQKADDAIPAIQSLVKREPAWRNLVESSLRKMDTPKAKEALQLLGRK
jgi:hypothetical protein